MAAAHAVSYVCRGQNVEAPFLPLLAKTQIIHLTGSVPITILPGTIHRDQDFELDPESLPYLWEMEEKHFWFSARNRWIRQGLKSYGLLPPATFLEVGCGSGAVARDLHQAGYRVTGIDTAEVLVRKAVERSPETRFVCGDVKELKGNLTGPYDAIGFFDVLEHLSDPGQILLDALKWSCPGTLVIATVPALKKLHSVIDDISGHKRRYEVSELKKLFESVGLYKVREHGIFRLLVPAIGGQRRNLPKEAMTLETIRQLKRDTNRIPKSLVNRSLNAACKLEQKLGFRFSQNKPGASLLVFGRVPHNT